VASGSSRVATLQDFRRILAVCPCCGEIFRLTDLMIAYRAKPSVTWLDSLEADEERQQRAEDKFAEDERQIRELAKERGRQALPRLLREAEPVFACRGYFAHDVKPLFDPVDYIIFDAMNASSAVTRIVLFSTARRSATPTTASSARSSGRLRRAITRGGPCGWGRTAGFRRSVGGVRHDT
jgi:hypothetical protein